MQQITSHPCWRILHFFFKWKFVPLAPLFTADLPSPKTHTNTQSPEGWKMTLSATLEEMNKADTSWSRLAQFSATDRYSISVMKEGGLSVAVKLEGYWTLHTKPGNQLTTEPHCMRMRYPFRDIYSMGESVATWTCRQIIIPSKVDMRWGEKTRGWVGRYTVQPTFLEIWPRYAR